MITLRLTRAILSVLKDMSELGFCSINMEDVKKPDNQDSTQTSGQMTDRELEKLSG